MIFSPSSRRRVLTGGVLVLMGLVSACGQRDPYKRTSLSGKVTLDGVPVVSGEVILTPDSEQGNSGPAVVAPISQGTYQSVSGNGPVAGAMLVRIFGYGEPTASKASDGFPPLLIDGYETKIEVPLGKGVIDFELKKDQLKKK